jgi:pimeloyl-ACP methyl ester carboxylesterase
MRTHCDVLDAVCRNLGTTDGVGNTGRVFSIEVSGLCLLALAILASCSEGSEVSGPAAGDLLAARETGEPEAKKVQEQNPATPGRPLSSLEQMAKAQAAKGKPPEAKDRPLSALEKMARQQAKGNEPPVSAKRRSGPVRYKAVYAYVHQTKRVGEETKVESTAVKPISPIKFQYPAVEAWEGEIEHVIEFPDVLEFRQPPVYVDSEKPRPAELSGAIPSSAVVANLTQDAVFRTTCAGTATQASRQFLKSLKTGEKSVKLLPTFGLGVESQIWLPEPGKLLEERKEGPGIKALELTEKLEGKHQPKGWELKNQFLTAKRQKELFRACGFPDAERFDPQDYSVRSVRGEADGGPKKFSGTYVHELRVPAGSGLFWTIPAGFAVDRGKQAADTIYVPGNESASSNYTFVYKGNPAQDAAFRIKFFLESGTSRKSHLHVLYEIDDGADELVLSLSALDANPSFFGGKLPDQLQPADLVAADQIREGASADGISQLIFRAELSRPQPVSITLAKGRGEVKPLLKGQSHSTGGKHYAFAVYTPPSRFGGGAVAKKPKSLLDPAAQPKQRLSGVLEFEDFEVAATAEGQPPDAPGGKRLPLKLVRPPVVLVHGLFSNPLECWVTTKDTGTSFVVLLERSGTMPFLVNYETSNGSDPAQKSTYHDNRFVVWDSPGKTAGSEIERGWLIGEHRGGWLGAEGEPPILSEFQRPKELRIGGIKQALAYYRNELHIAATQADVIGHSMGGLLARVYASQKYNPQYRRAENFNRGDISRLITICTPHHGTELPAVKDAIQTAKLEKANGEEEGYFAWGRRVLYRSAVAWFLEPEPGAIRDLRCQSGALADIGATAIPSFAIATCANESTAAANDFDPQGVYFHFYSGLGMIFFYNEALLDSFVARRAELWEQAGKQRIDADFAGQRGVAWERDAARRAYQGEFRALLDHNVMFWMQRREGAYRDKLRQSIEQQKIVPFGYLDNDQGESWLGDPLVDLSRIFLGGDLTAMRRVDLEPDIPYELITILRSLVFENDPRNDGAVRVLSQTGGLDKNNNVVLEGIVHSFAPWHYKVQRQCIDLLKWDDADFSPQGFGPAGQPLPKYRPLAAFHDDRVVGELAVEWSGMVSSHAKAIAELADKEDTVVIYRPVNRDCTPLIAANNATKNMLIKGKSADWGPQRGYIPREQRFSKFWSQFKKDRSTLNKKAQEYNDITEEMLANTVYPPDDDPDKAKFVGRKVAIARSLEVLMGKAIYEVWYDPQEPDAEGAIYLKLPAKEGYYDWRTAPAVGDAPPPFDPQATPRARMPAPKPEVVKRLKKLEVLADGLSAVTPKPYLTADYDLLAIGYRNSPDFHGIPQELKDLKQGKPHPTRGYITRDQRELVKSINSQVERRAEYRGGDVSHHGPENQYPASPYIDYPLLVFDPGKPGPGDAEVLIVRQGPPGFRDLHLKRYFEAKIRDKFNLYPNPDAKGWQWESWRAFSRERGYDPRDAARLPPYLEEAPRPESSSRREVKGS